MTEKSHAAEGMLRFYLPEASGIVVVADPGCAVALRRRSVGGFCFGLPANKIAISKIRQVHACIGEQAVIPGQPRVHLNEIVSAIFLPILELQRSQSAISKGKNQLAAFR